MVSQSGMPLLLQLLALIDALLLAAVPASAAPARHRGRPCVYSERLFLKAVVVMVVRHLPSVHALLAVLEQPDMAAVRAALCEHGTLPTRRIFERRLTALTACLPAQIAAVGTYLLGALDPPGPRAAAPSRLTARRCMRVAACGTKSSARPVRCPTPASTPRRIGPNRGPNRAGTAGSMAASCTSS